MDVSDIVNYGTIALWIYGAISYVVNLRKGQAVIPQWLKSNVTLGIIIVLGLTGSISQAYLLHRKPKTVEKTIEKPVEKIVEKQVPTPCPETKKAKQSPGGITVQSGAHVEGNANAPNSMAAGINTGTMMQGDVSPQFSKSVLLVNHPEADKFVTKFAVQVTTNHRFSMALTITGHYLKEFNAYEESESGAEIEEQTFGPWRTILTLPNVHSGRYIVTVWSTQVDDVSLEVSN